MQWVENMFKRMWFQGGGSTDYTTCKQICAYTQKHVRTYTYTPTTAMDCILDCTTCLILGLRSVFVLCVDVDL